MKKTATFTFTVALLGVFATANAAEHAAPGMDLKEMPSMAPVSQEMLGSFPKKEPTEIVKKDSETTLEDDASMANKIVDQNDNAAWSVNDETNQKEMKKMRHDDATEKKDNEEGFGLHEDVDDHDFAELNGIDTAVENEFAARSPYRGDHGDGGRGHFGDEGRGDHGDDGDFGRPGVPGPIRPPGYVGRTITCGEWLNLYPGYYHCQWPAYRKLCRFNGPVYGQIPRCSEIYCCRRY